MTPPPTLLDVEIEVLDEKGVVTKVIQAQVRSVRNNLAFLFGSPEGPYCLGQDECAGYWCCDMTSRERLSEASVEACRALQGSVK